MSTDCGCCAPVPAEIPAEIVNRPGLSAVAYRIGTFGSFRRAITEELSRTRALEGLSVRVSDDYTITAIELWSAVADVLTFYQERILNESFIRTATLRDSVLRLVRLIGYELRPGAAATTQLAFTLDRGAKTVIPVGTRVQSIPGEGEKPQKFETLEPVTAVSALNRLRVFPRPEPSSPSGQGSTAVIAAPDATALATAATLAAGQHVIFYAPAAVEILTVHEAVAVDGDLVLKWAAPLSGGAFASAYDAGDPTRRAFKLGRSFHLFGFDAPPVMVVPRLKTPGDATTTYLVQANTDYSLHGDGTVGDQLSLDARYDGLKPGATVLAVATVAGAQTAIPFEVTAVTERRVSRSATPVTPSGATAVTAQTGTVTQLSLSPLGGQTLANLLSGTSDIRDVVVYELLGLPLRFWPFSYEDTIASSDVFLPGRRAGWSSIEVGRTIEKGVAKPGTVLDVSDLEAGRPVLVSDGRGGMPLAGGVGGAALLGSGIALGPGASDQVTISAIGLAHDEATPLTVIASGPLQPTVPFPNSRRELAVTIGSLPTQTIALDGTTVGAGAIADVATALQDAIRSVLPGAPTFARALAFAVESAVVVVPGVPGDRVAFGASASDADTVAALRLDAPQARFLDGLVSMPIEATVATPVAGVVSVTLGIDPPVDKALTGLVSDATTLADAIAFSLGVTTAVTVDDRVVVLPPLPEYEPRTLLYLALELETPPSLDARSAVLLGNVAPASHGETIRNEIVGDGDASQAFQRFTLKKKPVTYVPAATPGGVASSLTLLVDGVKWTELPTLYNASSDDRVYVTRIADDGTLSVQFGDGVTGARLPSGRQNVVARYRQGIGVAGRVGAGKLATLLDRPTGVKNAANPIAADGGADPETLDRARDAAPGTVRTFGRAVSLRDFEDTALMAGEVAKASATWVWTGERRAIHLTVAAQGGATFSADGLSRIVATLATERDPNHKLLIGNYAPVAVTIDASIIVEDEYVTEAVLAAARAELLDALSFDRRSFAEPVYLSDVFRIIQDVDGVLAVDVNELDLKSTDATFRAEHGVDDALGQPQPRLLMLPARPVGSSGAVLPAELAWVEVPAQDVALRATGGLSS